MRDLPALREQLRPYLVADSHATAANHGAYTVRSLYYDTPRLSYYHEKREGLPVRKKVRIRVYDERTPDSIAFLEVKRKNLGWVSKSRAPVRIGDVDRILATGDIDGFVLPLGAYPKRHEHAAHFLYHMQSAHLRPSALVVYQREAFHGAFDRGFRLTLDYDLRCAMRMDLPDLYREDALTPYLEGLCVVEVKFARGLPSWVASVLEPYRVRREAVSKYCLGIDACRTRILTPTV